MVGADGLNLRNLLESDIDTIQQTKANLVERLRTATSKFDEISQRLKNEKVTAASLKAERQRLAEKRKELEKQATEIEEKAKALLGGA